MYRRLIAALLVAAPAAAAPGPRQDMGDWALATMPTGCMVEAVSPQGTMLTIWGFAGEPKLAFLLQNRGWGSLEDGHSYKLGLDFVGTPTAVPVDATARQNIDSDGPGFLFTVQPGGEGATHFINAFTSAPGMTITQDGRAIDTLPLAGSRGALSALARCLSERWKSAPAQADDGDNDAKAGAVSTV
jgi:hypothetical protein